MIVLLFTSGCSTAIGIRENTPRERKQYTTADLSAGTLNASTINLLGNYQLMKSYKDAPSELIGNLEQLYKKYRSKDIVAALADTSLQFGFREQQEPDKASCYFLAAAVYSSMYLKHLDDGKTLYDELRIRMIRINNLANTELFSYLKLRQLERKSGFELVMPGVSGRKVYFSKPRFFLPLPEKDIADFTPCANYRTKNLTHDTKSFGLGVPLVATLRKDCRDLVGLPLPGFPIAVTLVTDFHYDIKGEKITGNLYYIYSRTEDKVVLDSKCFPLATDFSTPVAKASAQPQKIHFLRRTLKVEEASSFTGLYLFEPYDDKRIPVIFVHGLMSDVSTWAQMLNTLLHDNIIRKKYQFMGFGYSSGNPVLYSGALLRRNLAELRNTLVKENRSTLAFDQMVLVGHSMGGLLSRLQISKCSIEHTAKFLHLDKSSALTDPLEVAEKAKLKEVLEFSPSPFIKRVIFIAVPHRGSEIARSWVGKIGASLIELPMDFVKFNVNIFRKLAGKNKDMLAGFKNNTGIDNLRPDAPILHLLDSMPMAKIPYHSIIGNNKRAFTPGGTDGIVPYWSSHLDNADSELIVHSGHSAHRSPLAIQEVRQILLLHAGKNTSGVLSKKAK